MSNWEVLRFSHTKRHYSHAKQLQRKTKKRAARANLFFLLIRSSDFDAIFIADPFSITRFIFFLFRSIFKQSFAFSPG